MDLLLNSHIFLSLGLESKLPKNYRKTTDQTAPPQTKKNTHQKKIIGIYPAIKDHCTSILKEKEHRNIVFHDCLKESSFSGGSSIITSPHHHLLHTIDGSEIRRSPVDICFIQTTVVFSPDFWSPSTVPGGSSHLVSSYSFSIL